jgi:hypothetical protein
LGYWTGDLHIRRGCAEARLPECPVIALRRKVSSETEHEFGYDLSWGGMRSSCIADVCGDLVL